jgi:hypothetical protein
VRSEVVTPEFSFPCAADGTPLNPFDMLALLVVTPPPPQPRVYGVGRPYRTYRDLKGAWPHPSTEPERVTELEGLLAADFDTFREVGIKHERGNGRVDLLAVPKAKGEFDEVVLAFEVKGDGYDPERALKQSADYVGGKVLNGITACFLYPEMELSGGSRAGMFNLIAQWRVGRAFIKSDELTLGIGYERIWHSKRGLVPTKARAMLLGRRTVGGSRKEIYIGEARPDLASLLGLNQTLTRGRRL